MSRVQYAARTYTIAAGETVEIARDSAFLTCLAALQSFKIGFDDGSETEFDAGLTYKPLGGFQRLQARNHGTQTNVITFGFGKGDISDSRLSLTGTVGVADDTGKSFADVIEKQEEFSEVAGFIDLNGYTIGAATTSVELVSDVENVAGIKLAYANGYAHAGVTSLIIGGHSVYRTGDFQTIAFGNVIVPAGLSLATIVTHPDGELNYAFKIL